MKMTMPATPMAMKSQPNHGEPPLEDFPWVCFLAFALLKVPPWGSSLPSSLIHSKQPNLLAVNRTHVRNRPTLQAFGQVTLAARKEDRDRAIVPVAYDNMTTCLMVYILTSLTKDFK